jgi:hypothetical protein
LLVGSLVGIVRNLTTLLWTPQFLTHCNQSLPGKSFREDQTAVFICVDLRWSAVSNLLNLPFGWVLSKWASINLPTDSPGLIGFVSGILRVG